MRKYGWVRDLPDPRDIKFSPEILVTLPESVDLRANCPAVYNQYSLGSCTAKAVAGAYEFHQLKEQKPDFKPSSLFIYYNTRVIEDTVSCDCGSRIRNAIKCVAKTGVCLDSSWPYLIEKFTTVPDVKAYEEAQTHQIISYVSMPRKLDSFKKCLVDGYPFVFGFSVYIDLESIEVEKTGHMPEPNFQDPIIGGHAVLAVGYDDTRRSFLCRNSWGADWGIDGYFYLPYTYFTNPDLSDDFWAILSVE